MREQANFERLLDTSFRLILDLNPSKSESDQLHQRPWHLGYPHAPLYPFLSLLPCQRYLITEPSSFEFVAWLIFKGIWVIFCPSGRGGVSPQGRGRWVVVDGVVGDATCCEWLFVH